MINLKSKEIEVTNKSKPFEHDKLGREKSAEILTQFVSTANEPFVMTINAPWGQGKTTFLRMWQAHLENKGFKTIYFNSWENDFTDDALVSILGEISSAIDKVEKNDNGDNVEKYLKKTKELGLKFLKKGVPAFIKGVTYNTLDLEAGIENTVASLTEAVANDAINSYVKSKESLHDFREALSELAASLSLNNDKKKPLVFIIDELDRCRPTFAIEVLEKVKHFFSVENMVFVLGVDKVQLGNSMKVIYGTDLNVNEYLRRFIDFDYPLPTPSKGQFAAALFDKYGFSKYFNQKKSNDLTRHEDKHALETFTELFELYELTLRQQEHCCSLLSLAIRATPSNHLLYPIFLCFLIVLKIKEPDKYDNLTNRIRTASEILVDVKSKKGSEKLFTSTYGEALEAFIISCQSSQYEITELGNDYIKNNRDKNNRKDQIGYILLNLYGWSVDAFYNLVNKLEIAEQFVPLVFEEESGA